MAAFDQYVNAVAMRESNMRNQAAGLGNMSSSLQNVAAQTGAPAAINPAEVPSIAGLASLQAGATNLSNVRQKQETANIKNLPKYMSSYRNYLQWRYPKRYGGGSSGSSLSNPYGDYDVPQLPGISGLPRQ
jgi:hypothetical protein